MTMNADEFTRITESYVISLQTRHIGALRDMVLFQCGMLMFFSDTLMYVCNTLIYPLAYLCSSVTCGICPMHDFVDIEAVEHIFWDCPKVKAVLLSLNQVLRFVDNK